MNDDDHVNNFKLTDAQAEMYDRQLRVWGVSTQLKIAKAKVLVIGASPNNLECAKNIVLAGVSKVVLCEGRTKEKEERINFLVSLEDSANKLSVAEAAAKSLQEMNPFGEVSAAENFKIEDFLDKGVASEILGVNNNYDVVICCGRRVRANIIRQLNELCRERKIAFFLTECSSHHGYFFSDLGDAFEYVQKKKDGDNDNNDEKETALLTKSFVSLDDAIQRTSFGSFKSKRSCKFAPIFCALKQMELSSLDTTPSLDEVREHMTKKLQGGDKLVDGISLNDLALFLDNRIEMPAIAAIVGGLLANEVIKAISHAEEPICNFFTFDVLSGKGTVEKLG
jgi:ubiquitin-like 1-activating enzyme E1 A